MAFGLDVLSGRDNMDAVIDDSSGPSDNASQIVRRPEGSADEGITVLVVDDERSNVESLEKIFLKENMRVLVANDAKHALDQVRNQSASNPINSAGKKAPAGFLFSIAKILIKRRHRFRGPSTKFPF